MSTEIVDHKKKTPLIHPDIPL